jgi:hypothetical protein
MATSSHAQHMAASKMAALAGIERRQRARGTHALLFSW